MDKTIYLREDIPVPDQRINDAYVDFLYNSNSSTGNVRDSVGWRKLKEAVYAVQRERESKLSESKRDGKIVIVSD